MKALLGFATAILTFEVTCLVQAVLHRFFGHRPLIQKIFLSHTGSHHTIYQQNSFEQASYSEEEASVSHTFAPAAGVIIFVLWTVLPFHLWLVAFPTVIATFIAHVHIHAQYHLKDSWLASYSWFQQRRDLHRIHHINQRKNFGVLEFFWDRMMGTLEAPTIAMDDQ